MGKNTYKFNGIECMENQYLFLIEIKDSIPKNILDIITKPSRDNWMLYNYEQMCEIYNGYKNGLSETDINMYAKINSYKLPMYSAEKMCYIKMALLEPAIYSRQLSKILAVTSEERPLYSLPTTKAIMSGCKHGLSDEEISLYTQLDSKHSPLFTGE